MEWYSPIYWQQYGIIFSSIRRWRQKREKKGRCSSCRGWVSESVSMGQGVSEWVKKRSKKKSLNKNKYRYNAPGRPQQKKQTLQLPHAWEARTPTLQTPKLSSGETRHPSDPSGGYSYFPPLKVIIKTRLPLESGGAHGTLLRAPDPLVMHTD